MCVVASTALFIASTAVSAAVSAYGAAQSAKAQNKQAEYNKQVATNNAAISRQEAAYAEAQAMRGYAEKGRETSRLMGAQRARQGASGVLVDSGSALDVNLDTVETGDREAMALLEEGDVQAWRAENQARGHETQARMAESSKQSVGAAVAGSLLTSTAQAGASYASGGFTLGSGSPAAATAPATTEEKYKDWR